MAQLSRDAYCSYEDFKFKHMNYKVEFFSTGSTQCFLVYDDKEIIVSFRGTEPTKFADIKADLRFFKAYEPGVGMVHRGFQAALNLVHDKIFTRVLELRNKQSLSFTGHSLGAALATLCMARFDDVSSELYTFGSPRVGDRSVRADFKLKFSKCFRFRNHNDVVTRAPKIGYYHIGKMYYFNSAGILKIDPSWWYRAKEFVTGMIKGIGRRELDSFADHSVDRYVHRLESYVEGIRWVED